MLITSALFGLAACDSNASPQHEQNVRFVDDDFTEERERSDHFVVIEDDQGNLALKAFETTEQEKQIARALHTGRESVAQEIRVVADIEGHKLGGPAFLIAPMERPYTLSHDGIKTRNATIKDEIFNVDWNIAKSREASSSVAAP